MTIERQYADTLSRYPKHEGFHVVAEPYLRLLTFVAKMYAQAATHERAAEKKAA